VVAGFVYDHPVASSMPTSNPALHVTVSEAEKIENTLDDLQLLRQLDSSTAAQPSESM
jgi:hypothetical protein